MYWRRQHRHRRRMQKPARPSKSVGLERRLPAACLFRCRRLEEVFYSRALISAVDEPPATMYGSGPARPVKSVVMPDCRTRTTSAPSNSGIKRPLLRLRSARLSCRGEKRHRRGEHEKSADTDISALHSTGMVHACVRTTTVHRRIHEVRRRMRHHVTSIIKRCAAFIAST